MTIHGTGYRPLEYEPTPRWQRLWAVALEEFRGLFRRRPGVVLYILCQVPVLIGLFILMAAMGVLELGIDPGRFSRAGEALSNPTSKAFYLDFRLKTAGYVVFLLLTCLSSCRAVAKDRMTDALEIYWTRGITPAGYFLAKWFGSFLLIGSVFVAGPLAQWCLGVFMAPDWSYLESTVGFVPRILLGLTVLTAALSFVAVGFSALARSPNFATILWLFSMLGTDAMGRLLSRVFDDFSWKAMAPWYATKRIVEWMAGVTPRQDFAPGVALAVLAVVVAVLVTLLARRLRLVEAIA